MTVTTVFSSAADGYITSSNTTYATARSGSNLVADTAGTVAVLGQWLSGATRNCYEAFLDFDTSSIPDTDIISAAILSVFGSFDSSTTDFTMNARLFNWGAGLTTADWVAGASLSGNTLLATFATSGYNAAGYNDFTNVAMPANVNKTGTTYMLISSSRHEGNNDPAGTEFVQFNTADQSGTTNDPKLTVTHTAPAVAVKNLALLGVG